jgi:hypothetical protein
VTFVGTRGERVGGKGSPSNVIAEDEEERRRAVFTRDRKGENGSEGRHIQDAGWWLWMLCTRDFRTRTVRLINIG